MNVTGHNDVHTDDMAEIFSTCSLTRRITQA